MDKATTSSQDRKLIPLRPAPAAGRVRRSLNEPLVEIPPERRHDSGTAASADGIMLAAFVAFLGSAVLGAGYGAVLALCAEKLVNISMALSFPFWMGAPAGVGFFLGHVQDSKWRTRIGLISFAICFYAVCVGWVAAVLDGPGLVLDPLSLAEHLADVSNQGVWFLTAGFGLERELKSLAPYLLTLRFGSLLWLLFGGFFSIGAALPYPYCRKCKCWMDDEAAVRFRYDPPSTEQARILAADLVAGRYEPLLALEQTVDAKAKGLQVNVYGCETCDTPHVLNATWYRSKPDPEFNDTEQLLESGTGTELVSGLTVPAAIHAHVARLAKAKADKDAKVDADAKADTDSKTRAA